MQMKMMKDFVILTQQLKMLKSICAGVHLRKKPFQCEYCSSWFERGSYLKDHVRAIHFKEKNNVCVECGQRYAFFSDLRMHVRTVHFKVLNVYYTTGDCHCGQHKLTNPLSLLLSFFSKDQAIPARNAK
jgi:hypothetical protein